MFSICITPGKIFLVLLYIFGVKFTSAAETSAENAVTDYPISLFPDNDLNVWQAPAEIRKMFTYYWSGFDEECRPIWVGELGKWDARKVIERGEDSKKMLRKYIYQGIYRLLESLKFNNTDCPPPKEVIGILDVEGFNYRQIASTATVSYLLNIVKEFVPVMMKYVQSVYFINTNFAANGLVTIARPILGEFMARVEVYGTRKSTWLPAILKRFPKEQLPEKLGGKKGFTPLKSYG
ncbi:unnamed protein product [Allacma fusca]|uniref:CRAL-TRIO domain-containing protein n=1 Tax=Allacma fusca TaxID=39272 RepID=A0A8J2Q5T1_9HEXA|nr:unnamed protein product [Allacma fusca]